ncbi:uncharacterized protein LOC136093765 [Hydra vulgaris]|uniref:uncharacterized protein LOC136093765 n=1 Tax=Hydra vulgaris TaxID=6087 RepID=UPI0032EA1688
MQQLKAYLSCDKPDIILVSETWFNDKSVINIDGYNCYNKNRPLGENGGGVVIYAKSTFITTSVSHLALCDNGIEQIWCSLTNGPDHLLIGCIYRPPSSPESVNTKINSVLGIAKSLVDQKKYTGLIITGDFNYPHIKWYKDGGTKLKQNCDISIKFIDNLNENFIEQCIFGSTFQISDEEPTNTHDLLMTDNCKRIRDVEIGAPLGPIEKAHYVIQFKYDMQGADTIPIQFNSKDINYQKGDYEKINLGFNLINWYELFKDLNVDHCYSAFVQKYNELIELNIPKKRARFDQKVKKDPCITIEVKALIRKKKNLWNQLRAGKFKYLNKLNEYKAVKKLVKSKLKESTIDYEKNLINNAKKNPRLFYKYAKKNQKNIGKIQSMKNYANVLTSDRHEIVNILNKSFQSVFVKEHGEIPEFVPRITKPFEWDWKNVVTNEAVQQKLYSLDVNKACGSNGISPYVLKNCSSSAATPLALIYRKSIGKKQILLQYSRMEIQQTRLTTDPYY